MVSAVSALSALAQTRVLILLELCLNCSGHVLRRRLRWYAMKIKQITIASELGDITVIVMTSWGGPSSFPALSIFTCYFSTVSWFQQCVHDALFCRVCDVLL